MNDVVTKPEHKPIRLLVPTLTKQCWGFMIGSAFFALASAPGLSDTLGASANLLCFIGAWFFTASGLIQLFLSGAVSVPVDYAPGRMVRAEWFTAASQSLGTILFNVSTTSALYAKTVSAQDKLVWNPDAGGSVLFLVSGLFGIVAYTKVASMGDMSRAGWWSAMINFVGCVAFAISAVGSYVLSTGQDINSPVSNWGTFIGAICFFLASLIVLPQWKRLAHHAS